MEEGGGGVEDYVSQWFKDDFECSGTVVERGL